MTTGQTSLYFREWGKVRAHYIDNGIDPKQAENKRHELHKKALGADKSSKDFTNADLDRVLAAFYAITRPADLVSQLRQLDQSDVRISELLARARDLATQCVSRPGLEGTYLDGMARRIFQRAEYHRLEERQLQQLCGILERRIAQLNRPAKSSGKQAVGELGDNCPW